MVLDWLVERSAPYKSPATISVDSGSGTRPKLRLLAEANDNASDETAGREMEKETGGKEWGKEIRAKVEWRKHVRKFQYA